MLNGLYYLQKGLYKLIFLHFVAVPHIVVISLFYNKTLDCSTISIPYIISAYFSMANRYGRILCKEIYGNIL